MDDDLASLLGTDPNTFDLTDPGTSAPASSGSSGSSGFSLSSLLSGTTLNSVSGDASSLLGAISGKPATTATAAATAAASSSTTYIILAAIGGLLLFLLTRKR